METFFTILNIILGILNLTIYFTAPLFKQERPRFNLFAGLLCLILGISGLL